MTATGRNLPPRRDEVRRRLIMIELDVADSKTGEVFEAFLEFADDWDPGNVDVSLTLADGDLRPSGRSES